MAYFNYRRRESSVVRVGDTFLGSGNPIRIQSMANVPTMDTEAAVRQAISLIEAGAEYVRFTAQGEREARNLGIIRQRLREAGYTAPLVADIHFNPRAADVAATTVEKVRINPGNYVDRLKTFDHIAYTDAEYAAEIRKIRERFVPFLAICREHGTAVRIGVNHGSLSDRIMSRYGDTPQGMVASCMEFLRICREEAFDDVVISIKASNTVVMVETVRLLVRTMDAEGMRYPLHLGVTEAGDGEDGRIKSAVGIGALLADGIGDTIRVSLSEAPEAELPVARQLAGYIRRREGHPPIRATLAPGYDPVFPTRRESRAAGNIGGGRLPVVVSDRSDGDTRFDAEPLPDYAYIGKAGPADYPAGCPLLVDAPCWHGGPGRYPVFSAADTPPAAWHACAAALKFVRLSYADLTGGTVETLKEDRAAVVLLESRHPNAVGELRAAMHRLMAAQCDVPVILLRAYDDADAETMQLKAAADFGTLLLDGFADGVMLQDAAAGAPARDRTAFGILQATRLRVSRTEYISCPGCGRTLYDMQAAIARVKAATAHLKGLKIGIMGCIVNGPGEMADADYGYVGAGRGRVSLYKGKQCVVKNMPEDEAVPALVELIKANGDWREN